jgi:hypothetical protein
MTDKANNPASGDDSWWSPEEFAALAYANRITLSEQEFARILQMLEDPPAPNEKLRKAIASLADD